MRTSRAFVLGAMMGATVVWLWGRKIEACLEERARAVRTKPAEGLRTVQTKASKALDGGADAVRPVEDFVQNWRETVSKALQAAREARRSGPAARNA